MPVTPSVSPAVLTDAVAGSAEGTVVNGLGADPRKGNGVEDGLGSPGSIGASTRRLARPLPACKEEEEEEEEPKDASCRRC